MTVPGTAAPVEGYRRVLQKVGLALIVVALLDIDWMAYRLVTRSELRSFFGVFALVPGILLMRGSLRTARVVALFSAFLFPGSVGDALFFAVVLRLPLQLIWLYLRLRPLAAVGYALAFGAPPVLLAWTYRMLTKPSVLTATDQRPVDHRHRRFWPLICVAAGALLVGILMHSAGAIVRSGAAEQARAEAKKQVGPGYEFFISSLLISSGLGGSTAVSATGVAYRDHKIKALSVKFERRR